MKSQVIGNANREKVCISRLSALDLPNTELCAIIRQSVQYMAKIYNVWLQSIHLDNRASIILSRVLE